MVKFIKQEAEEKANEISVSAEEVSWPATYFGLRECSTTNPASRELMYQVNALMPKACPLVLPGLCNQQNTMCHRSSTLRSCSFLRQRRLRFARTMREEKDR